MTVQDPPVSGTPTVAAAGPRRHWWRRRWLFAALAVVALVLGGLWLARLGSRVQNELQAVRTETSLLRTAVRSGDSVGVTALEGDIQRRAAAARADTDDPLWRFVATVPILGNDLKVARGLAAITDDLATRVLPPLSESVAALRPEALRRPDGSFELTRLSEAGSVVDRALPPLAAARAELARLDQRLHVNALAGARTQLGTQLADLEASLLGARRTLTLLPPMLGANEPRRYFLAFQNPAEARGTGGLIGAFGILTADQGRLRLEQVASDSELDDARADVALHNGAEFLARWGDSAPNEWTSANLTPHFPWAAAIWRDKAAAQFGGAFDGVLSLDPVALGLLLGDRVVPMPDGTSVRGTDLAAETMSGFYTRYLDNTVRHDMLIALARGASEQLLQGGPQPTLLTGLQASAEQGRIQIWSAREDEERALAATEVGGVLPDSDGAFAWMAVQNSAGNKADYWLDRELSYAAGPCPPPGAPDPSRESLIEVTLTNRIPPGEPSVVAGRYQDPAAPYGINSPYLSVYGAKGAELLDATLDGQPTEVEIAQERGRPVFSAYLDIPPGETRTVVLRLQEPATSTVLQWRPQPLARPQGGQLTVSPCR